MICRMWDGFIQPKSTEMTVVDLMWAAQVTVEASDSITKFGGGSHKWLNRRRAKTLELQRYSWPYESRRGAEQQ
jgi:hypothetical protein